MYFTLFKLQELNKKHQVFSLWNIDVERGTFVTFNLGFTLHLIHLTLLFFFVNSLSGKIFCPTSRRRFWHSPNIKFSSSSHFTLSFRSPISIRHSFYRISMLSKVHDGHAGNFSDASFQILVTRCNNVAFVLGHPIN